ncbi:MAG: tetratricopeptide repeat protein [Kiritimatiellia bacterium]
MTVNSGIFTAYGADAERRAFSTRLAALEQELAANQAAQKELNARIEEANRKLAEPKVEPAVAQKLREDLARAQTDLESVRRDLAKTEEAAAAKERVFLSNLDAAVEDRDALKLKLQENAQRVELATRQAEDLGKQLAALQQVKKHSEDQVAALSAGLAAARTDAEGLRKSAAEAEKLRLETQAAVAEREKRMQELNRQIEELGRRPAITQKELEELHTRMTALAKEKEALDASLVERTETGRLANEMLKRKEGEVAALNTTSSEVVRRLAVSDEQIKTLKEKVRADEAEFAAKQTAMTAEREKLVAELSAREEMIAGQRKALEEQKAASVEAARLKAGVDQQLARVSEQLAGEQKRRAELEALAKKHEALRGEISDLSRFLTDSEKDRQSQMENLAAIAAERDQLKRKVGEYERAAAEQQAEQEKQKMLLEEIRQTIKSAGPGPGDESVKRIEALNEQVFRNRSLLEKATQEKGELEVRILAMEAELARARTEAAHPDQAALDQARKEQEAGRKEIEELKQRVAEREKALAETLKNRAEAEAIMRDMEAAMKAAPSPRPPRRRMTGPAPRRTRRSSCCRRSWPSPKGRRRSRVRAAGTARGVEGGAEARAGGRQGRAEVGKRLQALEAELAQSKGRGRPQGGAAGTARGTEGRAETRAGGRQGPRRGGEEDPGLCRPNWSRPASPPRPPPPPPASPRNTSSNWSARRQASEVLRKQAVEQARLLAEKPAAVAPQVPVEPPPAVPGRKPDPMPPAPEAQPGVPAVAPAPAVKPAPVAAPAPAAVNPVLKRIAEARQLLRDQKPAEAAALFRAALEQESGNLDARVGLAYALNQSGDAAGAAAEVARVLSAQPFNARALGLKAIQQWSAKDLAGAVETIRLAVSSDPRDALLHNYQGIILNERGEIQAALAALRTAVELDPALVQAHFNLAVLLARPELQKLDEARQHYERSIQLGGEADERLEKLFHP